MPPFFKGMPHIRHSYVILSKPPKNVALPAAPSRRLTSTSGRKGIPAKKDTL